MSVTVAKSDGVTVLTVTSDPESSCPPVCQVLKNLCYSPVCCSVSQHLKKVQIPSQSVLGTLHVLVGLLCMGLGSILYVTSYSWGQLIFNGFPFWLGGLFVLFGFISILSEKCPSRCLVIISVILNLTGVAFAITAIVLYSVNLSQTFLWGIGRDCDYNAGYPSYGDQSLWFQCIYNRDLSLRLSGAISIVLIVLSVLELCVSISSAVIGIKALRSSEKRDNKSDDGLEPYKTLQEEVSGHSLPKCY